jgi:hypothetical protein
LRSAPIKAADTRGIYTEITAPLATGGAHVDSAAGFVTGDANDDVVRESKPTALLTRLDAPRVGGATAIMVHPGIDLASRIGLRDGAAAFSPGSARSAALVRARRRGDRLLPS